MSSRAPKACKNIVAVMRARLSEVKAWVPKENYESKNRLALLTMSLLPVGLVLMICEGGRMITTADPILPTLKGFMTFRAKLGEKSLKWRV